MVGLIEILRVDRVLVEQLERALLHVLLVMRKVEGVRRLFRLGAVLGLGGRDLPLGGVAQVEGHRVAAVLAMAASCQSVPNSC